MEYLIYEDKPRNKLKWIETTMIIGYSRGGKNTANNPDSIFKNCLFIWSYSETKNTNTNMKKRNENKYDEYNLQ